MAVATDWWKALIVLLATVAGWLVARRAARNRRRKREMEDVIRRDLADMERRMRGDNTTRRDPTARH